VEGVLKEEGKKNFQLLAIEILNADEKQNETQARTKKIRVKGEEE